MEWNGIWNPIQGEWRRRVLESILVLVYPRLYLPVSKVKVIAAAIPREWSNDSRNWQVGPVTDVIYLFDDVNTPIS